MPTLSPSPGLFTYKTDGKEKKENRMMVTEKKEYKLLLIQYLLVFLSL